MGIGGDRLTGISIVNAMDLYMKDADTEALIIIGETPYLDVHGICNYLDSNGLHKPVFAFLAGRAAAVRYGDDFLKRFGNGGLYPVSMNASISMLEDQGVMVVESMDILIPMLKTYAVQ
jgi:succinyl-CoA synthetase alpha subunit